jgi:hypothetical protein
MENGVILEKAPMTKHWIPLPSFKTTLIIIVVVVYTITLTSLFVSVIDGENLLRMPTVGNIITLGYEAHGGNIITNNGNTTLDWGTTYVGASTNRTFNLKSKSTITTIPQLNTTAWTFKNAQNQTAPPPTVNDITLSWTINNTPLTPNQEINVTLTLTVKYDQTFVDYLVNNNIRTFSFDIIIQPSQA